MGYRSDVVLAISRECWLREQLKQTLPKELASWDEHTDCGTYLRWFDPGIKWYPDFHEVSVIEKWLDTLDDNDEHYAFMRMGEEFGDIDERGSPYSFGIYATQTIHFE